MITTGIKFKNFKIKKDNSLIKKKLDTLISEKNYILDSLKKNYKDSYLKKKNKKI
tara:strand:+ start:579 stop:743 length:165 start_codon:yes stop_codon:yes gene_type:complete